MSVCHVAIRADATRLTGTGHFMRCLTLADGLLKRGAKVRLVSRGLPAHLSDILAQKKIESVALDSAADAATTGDLRHAHWLGCSQEQDAQATRQALADRRWDWLIVDHYALDARWESKLRGSAGRIMVIDDLADRQHDCDMLLDQNFYADMQTRYADKVPAGCGLLLGPSYALLREEFARLRQQVKPRSGPVKRILVFFGGVDAENHTGEAIDVLSGIGIPEVKVDVVIGAQHPQVEEIKASCNRSGYVCHVQTARMAELTAQADLAIGAGGSATWERCCLGLPSLVFCTAENQRQQLTDAARHGLLYAPDAGDGLKQALGRHLAALMENSLLRESLSSNGMDKVNGLGTERVIARLGISDIEIRTAEANDSLSLFQWRNHPSIREVSRDKRELAWETHQRWFESVLADPDRFLLIGQRAQTAVGVVRFDRRDDAAEISIYAVPGLAGRGVGQGLLRSAERWLADHHPEVGVIHAQVLGNNARSHGMFAGAGYEVESTYYSKRVQQP